MIFDNYKDFPRVGRIVGLDWGLHRCGVAVSDENRDFVFVRPQINIDNQNSLIDAVCSLLAAENAVGIVIGLPLYPDGTDSETTRLVRDFANLLATRIDLPIIFIEENLTSVIAQQEMGRVSVAKIKRELDSRSAKMILENAISLLKRA